MKNFIMLDIGNLRRTKPYLLLNSISIYFVGQKVIKDVPNIVAPMKKQSKEDWSQQKHWETSSEF